MTEKELKKVYKKFVHVKLKDGFGQALKSYAEGISAFKRSSLISCMGVEASYGNPALYKDSIAIVDFLSSGDLIVPRINGTFVYGRNLKDEELKAEFPLRIQNALVANHREIATPRIIGYFILKEKNPLVLTEYCGQQNLMSALGSGVRKQDLEQQKAASEAIRSYWCKEHELLEKYDNLTGLSKLLRGKSDYVSDWRAEVDRNREFLKNARIKHGITEGNPPGYINSMAFLVEKGELKGAAEKDLADYALARKGDFQALRELANFATASFDCIDEVCSKIGRALRVSSEKGILLLDVAPRDIILGVDGNPWFADMEHVEFHHVPLSNSQQERQVLAVKGEFLAPDKKCPYKKKELLSIIEKAYYE